MNLLCKYRYISQSKQEKMKNVSKIKKRILKYIDYKGINKRKFYQLTNIANGTLDKSSGLSEFGIEKFISTFDDINPEWLLTGKGSMIKSDAKQLKKEPVLHPANPGQKDAIPLVDVRANAGYGNFDSLITEGDISSHYVVPKFSRLKPDFMIEISGNSMAPKYYSGDLVAVHKLESSEFIQWGRPHLIGTRNQGIMVKRLYPSDQEGHYKCKSDNPEYPPFDVPLDEITGIALVVGVIRVE